MPSKEVSHHRRHPVVGLSVRNYISKVSEHTLQTACENFIKFTTYVQLRKKINWLDF